MSNIFLVRHGTTGLVEKCQKPNDALSLEGKKQLEMVADGINKLGVQIDALYTSKYVRAIQSGEELLKQLPYLPEKVIQSEIFNELPYTKDSLFAAPFSYIKKTRESNRQKKAIKQFVYDYQSDETVCIVAHGMLIGYFVTIALGLPKWASASFYLDNASLTILRWINEENRFILYKFNETFY